MRNGEQVLRPMAEPEGNSCERNRNDADQNRSANTARHENSNEKESGDGQQKFPVSDFAKAHERGRVRDNDFCIAKANERDEKTNARGGSMF